MELIIFAGPNGSGKSTIITAFQRGINIENFEYINPDIYAREYFGNIEDEYDRYMKAFKYAEYKRQAAVEDGKNFIIETVNSTDKKFAFYDYCKNKGYKITVVFVCTKSPEINVKRVLKRVSEGGHGVPEEKIISRYKKSLQNLFSLSLFADVLYMYDNSKEEGIPELCYYKDANDSKLSADIPEWVQKYFIDKLNEF